MLMLKSMSMSMLHVVDSSRSSIVVAVTVDVRIVVALLLNLILLKWN